MKRYLIWTLTLLTLAAMTLGAAAEGLEALYETPEAPALEASVEAASTAEAAEAQVEDPDPLAGEGDATLVDGEGDATLVDGEGDATLGDGEDDATLGDGEGDVTLVDGEEDETLGDEGGDVTSDDGEGEADPEATLEGETPEGEAEPEANQTEDEAETEPAQTGDEAEPEATQTGDEAEPEATQEDEAPEGIEEPEANRTEGEAELEANRTEGEAEPEAAQEGEASAEQAAEPSENQVAEPSEETSEKPTEEPSANQVAEPSAETSEKQVAEAAAATSEKQAEATSEKQAEATSEKQAEAPPASPVAEPSAEPPASPVAEAAAATPVTLVLGVREQCAIPGMEGAVFTSANRKVATVTAAGVVRGKKVGRTRVVAVRGAETVEYPVQVKKAPKKISFSKKKLTLSYDAGQRIGEQCALNPKLTKGSSSGITYSGYDPAIVSVSPDGVVTAVGVGTTRVTARTYNKKKAKITVQVRLAPGSSALDAPVPIATALAMGRGEKSLPLLGGADVNAVCGGVTFTSTNRKVAAVDALGVVTARKKGKATIRIRGANGCSVRVRITVYKAPSKVTLNAKKLSMDQYTSVKLNARLPRGQAGAVAFASSNEGVAQVDAAGTVSAVGVGSAVITVYTYNGKKAKCTVEVLPLSLEIRMADVARCATGRSTVFPVEVLTSAGERFTGPVSVTIDPADVAAYEDGRIRGLRGGQTAQLTVRASETTRSCAVIVEDSDNARPVLAIAHRGSVHWPENSLEAFRYFATTGADAVELDVRSTSDGVQVVLHDNSFYSNGVQLNVVSQTYETIKALFPTACTLDEALDVIAKSDRDIYLNPKETADGAKCVQAVRSRGLQSRTVYFCGTDQVLSQIYGADSSARLGYSLNTGMAATGPELEEKVKALHLSYIMLHKNLADRQTVDYWHERKCKVFVWTVNDKDAMRTLCDMGVEGILTDYPEYCVEARARG